jgi:hypothetical protein
MGHVLIDSPRRVLIYRRGILFFSVVSDIAHPIFLISYLRFVEYWQKTWRLNFVVGQSKNQTHKRDMYNFFFLRVWLPLILHAGLYPVDTVVDSLSLSLVPWPYKSLIYHFLIPHPLYLTVVQHSTFFFSLA